MMETYSRTMVAAGSLSGDGWNVWVSPDSDTLLAHKDGLTLQADIAQHGREAEELIQRFLGDDDHKRRRIERICWGCLHDGYTADEIEEVVTRLHTDRS